MFALVTAFGLAASTGLNTTLSLLLTGLLARYGQVELAEPYGLLERPWVLTVLAVLALAEFALDKLPIADSVVQVAQAPVAALAGAALFASQSGVISGVSPELGFFLGLLTGGTVHAARLSLRPVITLLAGGAANAGVSTIEDVYASWLTLVVVLAPVVGLLFLLLLLGLVAFLLMLALRRGVWLVRSVRAVPPPPPPPPPLPPPPSLPISPRPSPRRSRRRR